VCVAVGEQSAPTPISAYACFFLSFFCYLFPVPVSVSACLCLCPRHPEGVLCDLLWSDPDENVTGWSENNERGISFTFGPDVVSRFLQRHDLDLICRGHQVVQDGYEFFANRQLVTIFSAPNYCGEFDNAGAIMSVDETLLCSFQILKPSRKKLLGDVKKSSGTAVALLPSGMRPGESRGEHSVGGSAGGVVRARAPIASSSRVDPGVRTA